MRISKDDYNTAVGCLKRYNYNCINILNIRSDIMTIGSPVMNGMPKAPYSISDNVYNTVVKLQEDENLQKCLKEYKAVIQALELVNRDSKYIFEELYVKSKTKWDVIHEMCTSEETYKRRKRELIYAVDMELKKLT